MSALNILFAAVAFATAAVVVWLCVRWHRLSKTEGYKRLSARTYAWCLSFAIIPVAFGVLCLMDYYKGSPLAPFLLAAATIICAMATLHRENGKTFLRTARDFVSAYAPWDSRPRKMRAPRFLSAPAARIRKARAARKARRDERLSAREASDDKPSAARAWLHGTFAPWAKTDLVRLAVAALFAFVSLEICWHVNLVWMNFLSRLIDWAMILLAMGAMYFLFQRRSWGAIAVAVALYVLGIVEYFVVVLKGSVIQAGDIYALGTAAAVSDGLKFDFGGTVLLGAIALDLCFLALQRISPVVRRSAVGLDSPADASEAAAPASAKPATADEKDVAPSAASAPSRRAGHRVLGVVLNVLLACACALGAWGTTHAAYAWTQFLGTKFWQPVVAYSDHGFLTSFFSMWYGMPIEVPRGYSQQKAKSIEKKLAKQYDSSDSAKTYARAKAQFDQVKPSVIFVQNETFSDLSKFYDIGYTGYTGPEYFNSMSDTLSRGVLNVSVVGGGTCNSEFEFLTDNSMAYVGTGKYPYNLYNFSKVNSLAKQFKSIGYGTAAIHPNIASNWNRDKVYPQLGFDQFLDINDFQGAPVFHNGVTDLATYQKILELIQSSDKPMFITDITMQNHTGYDKNNIPADRLTNYQLKNVSAYENAEFNEYVSCIKASDEDLNTFIQELRQLNKPVVLVFYGDHQPNISSNYLNDSVYPNEDKSSLSHQLRAFKTQYFIWANYDVAGTPAKSTNKEMSIGYLSSYMMELIGAPLSNHQKANLQTMLKMPFLTLMGYSDTNGTWRESSTELTDPSVSGDSPAAKAYRNLDMVQYLEFGSKVKH